MRHMSTDKRMHRRDATGTRGRGISTVWTAFLVFLAVLVPLLAPATGSARARVEIDAPQLSTLRLVPGQTVVLEVAVPAGSWCRLTLTHSGARSAASKASRASSGLGQFSWRVPSAVAEGRWTAAARCAATRLALQSKEAAQDSIATIEFQALQGHRGAHGSAATSISVMFPRSAQTQTGKGGGSYPPAGTLLIPGSDWLDGHGVNVYSDGGDGADGHWQCVELINRLITTLHWSPTIGGNANLIYGNASPCTSPSPATAAATDQLWATSWFGRRLWR
jgi:hypothetical protein